MKQHDNLPEGFKQITSSLELIELTPFDWPYHKRMHGHILLKNKFGKYEGYSFDNVIEENIKTLIKEGRVYFKPLKFG